MYKKILEISKNLNSKFFLNYDVSKLTWFQTGGKADLFCLVSDTNELEIILNNLEKIPFLVIGAGSNILIRDKGFKGLIIKLGKSFNNISIIENKIIVGASMLDVNLSKFAYLNSIKNLEFFSGIPGTIGGAIKMNAGCFGNETKKVLHSIEIMKKNGKKEVTNKDKLKLTYRNSNLYEDIVLSASFIAEYGYKKEIKEKLNLIKKERKNSQPIKSKTSGSSFKNPPGNHAAILIEKAGCKGLKMGDAKVSNKHANFIINSNQASASQIEDLGKLIIDKVYNKFNILLDWEIKIIGDS